VSTIGIVVLSDVVTLTISLLTIVFISGRQWGELKTDIKDLKRDVAKIEGMFVIKIRSEHIDGGD
jgi:hypothetical protein